MLTYNVILAHKMTQFLQFSLKITYFHVKWPILNKLNPLMASLTTVMLINLTQLTFETVLIKNIFILPQNLVILFQFYSFFRVKAYFGGCPPISMNI